MLLIRPFCFLLCFLALGSGCAHRNQTLKALKEVRSQIEELALQRETGEIRYYSVLAKQSADFAERELNRRDNESADLYTRLAVTYSERAVGLAALDDTQERVRRFHKFEEGGAFQDLLQEYKRERALEKSKEGKPSS